MVHEHLSMTFDVAYTAPKESDLPKSTQPIRMDNLGWIRYNPYSHRPNLKLNDTDCEEAIAQEWLQYRALGGGCIVECTTHGIQRKAPFLRQLSRQTGVNIVAGAGYYVAASQSTSVLAQSVETMASSIRAEIVDHCAEATDIRCGLIGEIGCSWPLHGNTSGRGDG